jgi:hypothetical protein
MLQQTFETVPRRSERFKHCHSCFTTEIHKARFLTVRRLAPMSGAKVSPVWRAASCIVHTIGMTSTRGAPQQALGLSPTIGVASTRGTATRNSRIEVLLLNAANYVHHSTQCFIQTLASLPGKDRTRLT